MEPKALARLSRARVPSVPLCLPGHLNGSLKDKVVLIAVFAGHEALLDRADGSPIHRPVCDPGHQAAGIQLVHYRAEGDGSSVAGVVSLTFLIDEHTSWPYSRSWESGRTVSIC